jgi:ketosteroid isomerase-like protein
MLTGGVIAAILTIGPSDASKPTGAEPDDATDLRSAESAFAATMVERDHDGFRTHLDDEVVFFNGDTELRGPGAVADAWAPYFEGDEAPFSWRPEIVTVTDSGDLGLTSGPVLDPDGSRIGTFNSVWRRGSDGRWRIVFDRGCP